MSKLITQFIACPKCNGLGKTDQGLVCNECSGISTGTFIKKYFLYWGYDLKPVHIIIRQAKIIFDNTINIFSLIIGIGGIFSLIYWIIENAVINNFQVKIGTLFSFWGEINYYILYFWIGLLFLLFTYFRYRRKKSAFINVKNFKYQEWQKLLKQKQIIPNNWLELKNYKTKIDVSKSFDEDLMKTIEEAYGIATNLKHHKLTALHVFYIIITKKLDKKQIESRDLTDIFTRLEIFRGKIQPKVKDALTKLESDKKITEPLVSKNLKQALIESYLVSFDNKDKKVTLLDIINPLIENDTAIQNIFNELQVSYQTINNTIIWQKNINKLIKRRLWQKVSIALRWNKKLKQANQAVATPLLNYFCIDLTLTAEGGFNQIIIEREKELAKIYYALAEKKQNILLVGSLGLTKKALVKKIAQKIIINDIPKILYKHRIYQLDLSKLNQASVELSLEKKLAAIALELNKAKNIILFIENASENILLILNKYQNKFKILASTTTDINNKNFYNIKISEPDDDELIQILQSHTILLERKYQVFFTYDAITATITAGQKYLAGKVFPLKGMEILNDAINYINNKPEKTITARIIAESVSVRLGVPYTKVLK